MNIYIYRSNLWRRYDISVVFEWWTIRTYRYRRSSMNSCLKKIYTNCKRKCLLLLTLLETEIGASIGGALLQFIIAEFSDFNDAERGVPVWMTLYYEIQTGLCVPNWPSVAYFPSKSCISWSRVFRLHVTVRIRESQYAGRIWKRRLRSWVTQNTFDCVHPKISNQPSSIVQFRLRVDQIHSNLSYSHISWIDN